MNAEERLTALLAEIAAIRDDWDADWDSHRAWLRVITAVDELDAAGARSERIKTAVRRQIDALNERRRRATEHRHTG